jgi:hypothetical protein
MGCHIATAASKEGCGSDWFLLPKARCFLHYVPANGAPKADNLAHMWGELIDWNPILYERHVVHPANGRLRIHFLETLFCHALLLSWNFPGTTPSFSFVNSKDDALRHVALETCSISVRLRLC